MCSRLPNTTTGCACISHVCGGKAFDNAALEFERDYLPDLQRRIAEAKARQETAKQASKLLRVPPCLCLIMPCLSYAVVLVAFARRFARYRCHAPSDKPSASPVKCLLNSESHILVEGGGVAPPSCPQQRGKNRPSCEHWSRFFDASVVMSSAKQPHLLFRRFAGRSNQHCWANIFLAYPGGGSVPLPGHLWRPCTPQVSKHFLRLFADGPPTGMLRRYARFRSARYPVARNR